MNQLSRRYLEDFAVGQTFGSGRLRMDKERIFAFAAEFDPQPFHLDEAAASTSAAGPGRCAPATSCGSSARSSRCGRQSRVRSRV
jgi:acyl dehydratase